MEQVVYCMLCFDHVCRRIEAWGLTVCLAILRRSTQAYVNHLMSRNGVAGGRLTIVGNFMINLYMLITLVCDDAGLVDEWLLVFCPG